MEQKLNKAQLATLRDKLERNRARLQKELSTEKSAVATTESESQDYELAYVEDLDQTIDTEVDSHRNFELNETEEALERISSGGYGVCQDCGEEIGVKRLMAYPMARRCFSCKEIFEKKSSNT